MKTITLLFIALQVSATAHAANIDQRYKKACMSVLANEAACDCVQTKYADKRASNDLSEEKFELIVKAYEGDKAALKELDKPKYEALSFFDEDATSECEKEQKAKAAK